MEQIQQLLQAFFQANQMSPEDQQKFMQEFQGMSPEDQQKVIQYIQNELSQGSSEESMEQPSQQSPQEEMVEQAMEVGGMRLAAHSNRYTPIQYEKGGRYMYQSGGDVMYNANEFNTPDNPEMNPQLNPQMNPAMTISGTPLTNAQVLTGHSEIAKYPIPDKGVKIPDKEVKKISQDLDKNKAAQKKLVDMGYSVGKYKKGTDLIDGIVGAKTKAALEAYATDKGMSISEARTKLGFSSQNSATVKTSLTKPTASHKEASESSPKYNDIKKEAKNNTVSKGIRLIKDDVEMEGDSLTTPIGTDLTPTKLKDYNYKSVRDNLKDSGVYIQTKANKTTDKDIYSKMKKESNVKGEFQYKLLGRNELGLQYWYDPETKRYLAKDTYTGKFKEIFDEATKKQLSKALK